MGWWGGGDRVGCWGGGDRVRWWGGGDRVGWCGVKEWMVGGFQSVDFSMQLMQNPYSGIKLLFSVFLFLQGQAGREREGAFDPF